MDEFILKDYASWKLENIEMLETFKFNKNPIYDRLEPIYVVLEKIYTMVCEKEEVDEDLEHIFNVGFQYLYSQVSVIKIYFESLFKSNCDDFNEYSEMIVFLLYIFDLRTDLETHEIDSDIEALNNTETYIENMIMERRQDFEYVHSLMSKTLQEVEDKIDYEYVSIVDIYVEIAENLGIFLYEDDEPLVIGEEL